MTNEEMGWIEQWLLDKKRVKLTAKGRKWAMNLEGTLIMLFFLASILLVGFIEGYGNH